MHNCPVMFTCTGWKHKHLNMWNGKTHDKRTHLVHPVVAISVWGDFNASQRIIWDCVYQLMLSEELKSTSFRIKLNLFFCLTKMGVLTTEIVIRTMKDWETLFLQSTPSLFYFPSLASLISPFILFLSLLQLLFLTLFLFISLSLSKSLLLSISLCLSNSLLSLFSLSLYP